MFCTQCGTRNDDTALHCSQCGAPLRQATPSADAFPALPAPQQPAISQGYVPPGPNATVIPNYLVQAILVTIFCCLPFGIVSMVYSSQVNTKVAMGDVAGAMQASKQAKLFAWIGFGITALGVVGYLAVMMLFFAGAIASGTHVR